MSLVAIYAEWANGNRKDAVRKLARSPHRVVRGFTAMLVENNQDVGTFVILVLDYGVTWE